MVTPTNEQIDQAMIPDIGSEGDHDIEYDYRAPNGRWFNVRKYQGKSRPFFLEEMVPNGKVIYPATIELPERIRASVVVEVAKDSPNEAHKRIEQAGIDPETNIIYTSGAMGSVNRFYATRREAADQIRYALETNTWYDATDYDLINDSEYQAQLKREEEADQQQYWAAKKALYQRSLNEEEPMFRGLYAVSGLIDPENKAAIKDYLANPTEPKWDAIYSLCIKGITISLWQAWIRVDEEAPLGKRPGDMWPSIPRPDVLKEAMVKAAQTDRHHMDPKASEDSAAYPALMLVKSEQD